MKAIAASKKLIVSIISLVLSLVMCVSVCLAWFAVNKKVQSNLPNVSVRNGDIVKFDVTVHYLDSATGGYSKATTGNVTGSENVDKDGNGKLSEVDDMRPYGGLGNTFATAVLFEIKYELITSSKHYRIFASCPQSSSLAVEAEDSTHSQFTSALSNAVGYYGANESSGVFSKASESASTFVNGNSKPKFTVSLQDNIVPAAQNNAKGNYEGTLYAIMDYMPDNFIYLSSLMIKDGGSLTSGLSFTGDLSINIETYDPDNPVDPQPVDPQPVDPDPTVVSVTGVTLDKTTAEMTVGGETLTLTATVEPSNATNRSVSWSSSNESVATVTNGVVTAVGAGTTTITATTADGNKTAQCTVTVNTVEPPTPDTPKNLFDDLPTTVKSGVIINNDNLTFSISGSAEVTALSTTAECSDGTKFNSYLFPSGGRTYTVEAKKDITIKIYYTVRDSSSIKSDNVTATVDGTVVNTSSDGTREDDKAYVMEISLTAGQKCVFASAKNRLVLYGLYIN